MIKKLTTIMVTSFFALNALFITGISLVSYKIFTDFTSREISEMRLALLNESTGKVSNFITSISDAGIYIVVNDSVIRTFSNRISSIYDAIVEQRELTELVQDMVSLKEGIHSIEIYTDRYRHYPEVSDNAVYPMDVLTSQPWSHLLENADNVWVPKHISPVTRQEVISYVHRLMNYQGNTVGYVKVNVLADTFFAYMSDENLFQEMEEPLLLLDAGGRVIARTHTSDSGDAVESFMSKDLSEPYDRLRDPYSRLSNHHQVLRIDNEAYLFIVSKPTDEQWRLVHLIPIDTLYAKTRRVGWFVLILGFGSLLLSLPLVYWVGRRIVVPLRKIIRGMKEVQKGNFDVRVDPNYIEEYDTLAKSFNHMTKRLDESLARLNQENRAKREAELRALQSQIMPHFLYNTLDMIHWRAMDYDAEDISTMVNELSKMFRIGLSGGQKFISIRDELEHVKSYIHIQRARLNKDIQYEVKIPAALKAYFVPKIILQPFIENSMRHGHPDGYAAPVHIRISARTVQEKHSDFLEITIADNGIGLPEGWKLADCKGIGIKNVQERIWLYCGEHYGVELFNHEYGGTCVQIKLPVIKSREQLETWLEQVT